MSRPDSIARSRTVISRGPQGQPRTYRVSPAPVQQAAYRRLAAAILGLDVATLARELRSTRHSQLARAA
jgi:hypothetical protein